MSADLSAAEIHEAYDAVRSADSPVDWLLLGYAGESKDRLMLAGQGADGVEELRSHLVSPPSLPFPAHPAQDRAVLFGLIRLEHRFLLVTFLPEETGGVKRARALVHSRAVGSAFRVHHASVSITRPETLSLAFVRSKLKLDADASSLSVPNSPNLASPSPPNSAGVGYFPSQLSGNHTRSNTHASDDKPPLPDKEPSMHSTSPSPGRQFASLPSEQPLEEPLERETTPPPIPAPKQDTPGTPTLPWLREDSVDHIEEASNTAIGSPSEQQVATPLPLPGSPAIEQDTPDDPAQTHEDPLTEEDHQFLDTQAEREAEAAEQESLRRAEFERERARLDAQAKERLEAEEAIRREAAENQRREEARIAEELRAEQERARLKAEQEARIEVERQRLENLRLEEEERIRRVEEARLEKENQRNQKKLGLKAQFDAAKTPMEVILTGNCTVQGGNSVYWRRRFYQLSRQTLSLYKNERDTATPVDSITLPGRIKSVTDSPEEVQIPHSFKITFRDYDEEPMFIYGDEEHDKDMLVHGILIAAGLL